MDDLTVAQWGAILRDMAEVARRVHAAETMLEQHTGAAADADALLADADARLQRMTDTLDALATQTGFRVA
jgi:hypothetical protein